eukprot:GHUV01039607.1.p1 GENE.GHUV01039607.1~~GHUV01039607.1.p1  ORF type:complete len:133 (+),score=18.15 GHUV01039607.1:339-737(+)
MKEISKYDPADTNIPAMSQYESHNIWYRCNNITKEDYAVGCLQAMLQRVWHHWILQQSPTNSTQAQQPNLHHVRSHTYLLTPNAAATFSLVAPIGIRQPCALGNCSTRGLMPPSQAMGLADMVSTPAARPTV